MDPALLALCGLVIGLTLLAGEFFIPSGGMILILAVISLLVGVWGAWKAWGETNFTMFLGYIVMLVVLAPGTVAGGLLLLQRTRLGNRVLLRAPTREDVTAYTDEEARLRELIGQVGQTAGLLSPGGMVEVDGTRYHCESQGMMIDSGTAVQVIDVRGMRLVVREMSESIPTDTTVASNETAEDEAFDFDIPQS